MKVLLDHNLSSHLKPLLPEHQVTATWDRRWDRWDVLRNGDLIRAGEDEQFDVLVTADKKMFREQSHRNRVIALVVLSTNKWKIVRQNANAIHAAISRSRPGSYELVELRAGPPPPSAKAIE